MTATGATDRHLTDLAKAGMWYAQRGFYAFRLAPGAKVPMAGVDGPGSGLRV